MKQIKSTLILFLASLVIISNAKNNTTKNQIPSENVKVTISYESYFDPIPPKYATMGIYWPSEMGDYDMNFNNGKFICELSIKPGIDYHINIKTNIANICGENDLEWIASRQGIRAKKVTINNETITNKYLFDNQNDGANIVFSTDSLGKINPGYGSALFINTDIPSEVSVMKEYVNIPEKCEPNNKYANAWYSVIHDRTKPGTSKVEIFSLKLFARLSNGSTVTLASDIYRNKSFWEGKLYIRYPYFRCPTNPDYQWNMPAQLTGESLVFSPSDNVNRVWHGWCSGTWPRVPENTEKLWVEAEILITGNALLQLGVDIRGDLNTTNDWCEYGAGNWYFETESKQTAFFNKNFTTDFFEINSDYLNLSPNPVKNILRIQNKNSEFTTLEIINIYGELLLKTDNLQNNTDVDFSEYQNGMYILCFRKAEGKPIYKKVLKN